MANWSETAAIEFLEQLFEAIGLYSTTKYKVDAELEDPLLAEQLQMEEEEREREWVENVCSTARKWFKLADSDTLREEHFFFNMLCTKHPGASGNDCYGWWMDSRHPVARMIRQSYVDSNYHPLFCHVESVHSDVGSVLVFRDSQVNDCVANLASMCRRHGHAVELEEDDDDAPPVVVIEQPVDQKIV